MDENAPFAFSASSLPRNVAGSSCVIWQQSRGDCPLIEFAHWGLAIPLHRESACELWLEQSPFPQKEADIGAPITRSAPTTQTSLRQEMWK
jgi:hypothetical protein